MIKKNYRSEVTEDYMCATYYQKSHKAYLYINSIDDLSENIKLLRNIIEKLKIEDIKWIYTKISKNYEIPENAVFFIHDKSGDLCCHIEDFEKFYLKNIDKIVHSKVVHVTEHVDNKNDGWKTVQNKNTLKKQKLEKIKIEAVDLVDKF